MSRLMPHQNTELFGGSLHFSAPALEVRQVGRAVGSAVQPTEHYDITQGSQKKLKHYFEVRRLEDGFDLSGTDSPKLDHPPLKSRPTLLYDGLHDRPLKHYFHPQEVRTKLTHFNTPPGCESREKKVRRMVEKQMRKSHYVAPAVADVMYRNELRRQGKEVPPPNTTGFGIPLRRRRGKSAGGASYPVLRNAPPRYLSSGEAHRLVNMATKLLVATETIDLSLPVQRRKENGRKQLCEEVTYNKRDDCIVTYDANGRLIRLKKVEDDSAYVTPRESSPTAYSEDKIKPWLQ
ncbi:hypothetical protein LSAT2_010291 [Lamellibrachia satsuma]|nr:hypothetical protein LSAT2_010291 [Lamellibrachia satsuma]